MTEYFLVPEGDGLAPFCDRVVTILARLLVCASKCGGPPNMLINRGSTRLRFTAANLAVVAAAQ